MRKQPVSSRIDSAVYDRIKECAKLDNRPVSRVLEMTITSGIEEVEKRLREAGVLPKVKKPPVKSFSTIMNRENYPIAV